MKIDTDNRFDLLSDNLQVFRQILDQFPYSVNVTNKDGFMVYANNVFFDGVLENTRNTTLGNYNIFDEEMIEKWGLKDHIEKAFRGERVFTATSKLAYKDLGDKYGKKHAPISVYNDITSFPIFDDNDQLKYVVTTFVPVKKYVGRDEIVNAIEYIDNNWLAPFDLKKIAKTANLSSSHFSHLFKAHTGFSPHEYYVDAKINHVKEKLLDFNVSVSQAFNQCGIDYNSYYVSLFKSHSGLTPTQYRKNNK